MKKNEVLETMEKRSSVRAYREKEITQEMLETILTAGLQAPTATNRQEIRFSIVRGNNPVLAELDAEKRKMRDEVKQPHNFYYEAPALIFVSAEDGFKWSELDAGIAVQNMALAAKSLGLGSLIIGCIYDALRGERKTYFDRKLKIPEGYSFQIAVAIGYSNDTKEPHKYEWNRQVTVVE